VYDAHVSPSEDQCAVCSRWPPALREAMRQAIFRIPPKEPIRDDCVVAFWVNTIKHQELRRASEAPAWLSNPKARR
jgi:hypothetical protein